MEGLSGAASVIAVASIAIQLTDSIKKLCDFWESIKDAPEEIATLVQELKLLDLVLKRFHVNEKKYGADPATTLVLTRCAEKVDALVTAMNVFQPGFSSKNWKVRTWNSFKVTLQSKKFRNFRLSLEEMKTTLILARQDLSERMQYTYHDRNLTAISEGFAGLKIKRSSSTVTTSTNSPNDIDEHVLGLRTEIERMTEAVSNPWLKAGLQVGMEKGVQDLLESFKANTLPRRPMETRQKVHFNKPQPDLEKGITPFMPPILLKRSRKRYLQGTYTSITRTVLGVFYFMTRQYNVKIGSNETLRKPSLELYEYETHFVLHPAQWLLRWGLGFGIDMAITKSVQGWKNSIRTFRAVPDDSLIFDFCKSGNVPGVRSLLSRGEASPWDTNSLGWTPLHFASWNCNIELCKLLLEAGADKEALTYDFPGGNYEACSALVTASTFNKKYEINPIQRVNTLRLLLSDVTTDFTDSESQEWNMIMVLLERERPSSKLSNGTKVSTWVLEAFSAELKNGHPADHVAWLLTFTLEVRDLTQKVLDISGNNVDASFGPGGFTAIHSKIAEGFPSSVLPSIKLLAERGANLHLVGCTTSYGAGGLPRHDTPTSLCMRRSSFFFKWRQMLTELSFDFETFVDEELQQFPLSDAGWDHDSLLELFTYQYEPIDMKNYCCFECNREVYRVYDINEDWWEAHLNSLKRLGNSSTDSEGSISETFSAQTHWDDEKSDSVGSGGAALEEDQDLLLCWKCGLMQKVRTSGYLKRHLTDDDRQGC